MLFRAWVAAHFWRQSPICFHFCGSLLVLTFAKAGVNLFLATERRSRWRRLVGLTAWLRTSASALAVLPASLTVSLFGGVEQATA